MGLNNIVFEYKNQMYEIWINERNKSKKGVGNVKIFRLETFYPIQDKDRIKFILETFTNHYINDNLKYYKNTAGNKL